MIGLMDVWAVSGIFYFSSRTPLLPLNAFCSLKIRVKAALILMTCGLFPVPVFQLDSLALNRHVEGPGGC